MIIRSVKRVFQDYCHVTRKDYFPWDKRGTVMDAKTENATGVTLPAPFSTWFASKGWSPREHQLALLERTASGHSALLIAPTGAGKTLAGFLPSLIDINSRGKKKPGTAFQGIHTLYISPLKALAVDI